MNNIRRFPRGKYLLGTSLQEDLECTIDGIYEDGLDAQIKVSVYDLFTGASANVREKEKGWAASTIKVPVLVAVCQEIEKNHLSFKTTLPVNHKFTLEKGDKISQEQEGARVSVAELLYHMIKSSDNEATNMLVDKIGIDTLNKSMWGLGMDYSMLGHLLCPNVPRYSSKMNPDGSNITSTKDMAKLFRHIYDDRFNALSEKVKYYSDYFLSYGPSQFLRHYPFRKSEIKAKVGIISDPVDGDDNHETGLIDGHIIVSIMFNKIHRELPPLKDYIIHGEVDGEVYIINGAMLFAEMGLSVSEAYGRIMETIGDHLYVGRLPPRTSKP